MGRLFVWAAVLISALLLPEVSLAQKNFIPRFEHFGVEDGLSQSSAVCLAQDGQGFLWIGSYAGLNRYDGFSFKTFLADEGNTAALQDSNIRTLTVDSSGTLWIGTRNGGLSKFDSATGSFVTYKHVAEGPGSLPGNEVHVIHQDSSGLIRVGTSRGLAEFNPETGLFSPVPIKSVSAENAEIVALAQNSDGQIWAASRRQLFVLDKTANALVAATDDKLAKILSTAQINQLFFETGDKLWVVSDVIGLLRLDLKSGTFERHLHGIGVFKMLRDRFGVVWAATMKGLGRLSDDGVTRRFDLFGHNPYNSDTISQDDVISLLEDSSGILWAGTYSGGLNKLVPGSRWFAAYRHVPGDPASLPGKEVSAVCLGKDGQLWVGTRYNGLAMLNGSRKLAGYYRNIPGDPSSLAEDQINCVMEDSRGRIWVGTVEQGISVLDRSTSAFFHYRHQPGNPESLSQDKVWWLFEDKDGAVWAGTSTGGLNRIDPATGRVTRYLNDPSNTKSISHNRVRHIMQTRDGTLWLGTNAGLNRFDPANGTFERWRFDPNDPTSLSNDRVTPIIEDAAGKLWVGTDNGLNHFDPRSGKSRRYTRREGLVDDGIQGLALDVTGKLWMSTFKGISRLDPETGEVRNYSRRDGLVGVEFYMNAFCRGRNGEMFFGSFSGLNSFFPLNVLPNLHVPPLAVTEMRINNRMLENVGAPESSALRLEPGDQSLSIELAAMDFTNPYRNQYSYMLEGFDKDWVLSDSSRRATYTNLNPGNYRFLAKASNNEGYWNPDALAISVMVIPPYWKTGWFQACMTALAVITLYSMYFLRLRSLKARRRELEDTVARQTASLRVEIEERARTEEELRQSQQHFQAIFQYSPVGVAISSERDKCILQMNQAFCQLTGYSSEQLLGRSGTELGLWVDRQARERFLDEVQEKGVVLNRELEMVTRSGTVIPIMSSASRVEVFAEPCVLWLVSDISERKNLEMKLIEAREKAEAANQAKTDFLANISHEIRSPMNAILGLTELALRQEPPETLKGHLGKINSASHVLLGIINDLLDLSKIEAGKMELYNAPFSLKSVLDRMADIFSARTREKGVGFSVTVEEGVPNSLVGDSLRLEQVLINLVGNAVKFTAEGGVSLMISCQTTAPDLVEISFIVRDTGIGMSRDQVDQVFKPFVQADNSMSRRYEGTGLGLSIVSKLAGMMRGNVSVQSELGKGSVFTFTAPFGFAKTPGEKKSTKEQEDFGLEGIRALVVDDNALNRELTSELLKMAGMDVSMAEGGKQALQILEKQSFDVALLDVQMPGMDGYALARAIRERFPESGILLLALTAHGMTGDKELCLQAGMNGYLTKPVLPEVLFATLRRELGRGLSGSP